mgnify:CR=1 FL=1
MANHIVIESKLNNFNKKIKVSSDKSISIRSVLLASQAVGISKISNLLESEDVLNSLKAKNSLDFVTIIQNKKLLYLLKLCYKFILIVL